MLKKFFVIVVLSTVIVASVAIVCSASITINDKGCNHGYNGSYYFDQAWAEVYPSGSNYKVTVKIKTSSNATYGAKTTTVIDRTTTTCYSTQHHQVGGVDAKVTVNAIP